MMRMLITFASYEPVVGYVQGMSFIAAALLYHCGEVGAFWMLVHLMDSFGLKEIFKHGLPGLAKHEKEI
jgi:hypothetical protein